MSWNWPLWNRFSPAWLIKLIQVWFRTLSLAFLSGLYGTGPGSLLIEIILALCLATHSNSITQGMCEAPNHACCLGCWECQLTHIATDCQWVIWLNSTRVTPVLPVPHMFHQNMPSTLQQWDLDEFPNPSSLCVNLSVLFLLLLVTCALCPCMGPKQLLTALLWQNEILFVYSTAPATCWLRAWGTRGDCIRGLVAN